jgi:hypothetical protein
MSAAERIAGSITEGAVFIKRGKELPEPDKVMPTLEEALKQVIIEWKD